MGGSNLLLGEATPHDGDSVSLWMGFFYLHHVLPQSVLVTYLSTRALPHSSVSGPHLQLLSLRNLLPRAGELEFALLTRVLQSNPLGKEDLPVLSHLPQQRSQPTRPEPDPATLTCDPVFPPPPCLLWAPPSVRPTCDCH